MRSFVVVLAVAGAIATASAQSASTRPQPSPATGLLLGTTQCPHEPCGSYGTYWIVREGDRVRVAASGTGLLVPRKDGFWWVDTEDGHVPFTGGYGGMLENESEDSTAGDTTSGGTCPIDENAETAGDTIGWPSKVWLKRAEQGAWHGRVVGDGTLTLNWVSGDWIALSEESSAGDGEHSSSDRKLISLAAISQGTDSSPPAEFEPTGGALERAAEACKKALNGGDEEVIEHWPDWTVFRRQTRWTVNGRFDDTEREKFDGPGCDLPTNLTTSLIGYDRFTTRWSAIKDVLPAATTAFESPNGDLLLVLQDEVWYAFFPKAGVPGPVIARLRIHGAPVMSQWAVGAHVARWTSQVTPLLTGGAPARSASR